MAELTANVAAAVHVVDDCDGITQNNWRRWRNLKQMRWQRRRWRNIKTMWWRRQNLQSSELVKIKATDDDADGGV